MEEEQWECLPGVCGTPGAEGLTVYGVRVRRPDGSTWVWPDVDVDPEVVRRLVTILQTAQPERCHYEDVVLNFIQQQAEYTG